MHLCYVFYELDSRKKETERCGIPNVLYTAGIQQRFNSVKISHTVLHAGTLSPSCEELSL